MSTLSAAATAESVNTVVPVYLNGSPITDEGSLAYLAGALYQAGEFYERTGNYESLWRYGVCAAGTKTAVDSIESVFFATGVVEDPSQYSVRNPCPPTIERKSSFDDAASAASPPTPNFAASVRAAVGDEEPSHDFVVNPFKIREYDRDFANSLINIIKDHRLKARLLKECKGTGRSLVKLITLEAAKATPKERTLAYTEWQSFAMKPFVGDLNIQSFEAHYEEYEMLRNRVPETMRGPDVHVVEHLNNIMYHFDDISHLYSVDLKVEKPDPEDLEAHLILIRSALTDRRTSKKLSEAVSGCQVALGSREAARCLTTLNAGRDEKSGPSNGRPQTQIYKL